MNRNTMEASWENARRNFKSRWLCYAARIIGLAWASFWLFFGIASSIGENLQLTGMVMHVLFPGVIFLGIALLAWRWETHGAVLFIAIGVIAMALYPVVFGGRFSFSTVIFVELTMALPPIIAGILLLIHSRKATAAGFVVKPDEN